MNNKANYHIYNLANALTLLRIVLSVALLFIKNFSVAFYILYLSAGIGDMLDGFIARKTNTETPFGAKFDTLADIIFVFIVFCKVLPLLTLPIYVYIFICTVFLIKITSIFFSFFYTGKFLSLHSLPNKITGILLFIFPLTINIINTNFICIPLCIIALISAVSEFFYAIKQKPL